MNSTPRPRANPAKFLVVLLLTLAGLAPALRAQTFGEAACTLLNDYPADANPGWQNHGQGVAHDNDHWFITQKEVIWKIPVAHDLGVNPAGAPGVWSCLLSDAPQLRGYEHFGDPELVTVDGQGYLFVPVTEYGPNIAPAIAVFSGSDLRYLTHLVMPHELRDAMAWCAFDPEGRLYIPNCATNEHDPLTLLRYTCDYTSLTGPSPALVFTETNVVRLFEEAGAAVDVDWKRQQGGVITPSGEYLYVVAGLDDEARPATDGIHVFKLSPDRTTGRRINRSTQATNRPFIYQFDNGSPNEEPEGITFWDLDDGRAPGIRGQIHALMIDNDWSSADEAYLKHYTFSVFVDGSWSAHYSDPVWGWLWSLFEAGRPGNPFDTITEASNAAWAGADLRIKAGAYPEALTFSKTMRIIADGGPVTIGR